MRIVIGEDEALMRRGLTLVVERAGHEVAAVCADAPDLLRRVAAHHPDVVITDIRMPPRLADDGLQAALTIRERHPETAVMVLSQHAQRTYAMELLSRGAGAGAGGVGYLLKERVTDVEVFCADLERIARGGTVMDPSVVSLLVSGAAQRHPGEVLTDRQREVLSHMAEGRSNAAIADRLGITEKAVVRHVSHVYDALGLAEARDDHRRVLAVLRHLTEAT
jgi:DNA-binding NarL/FixJ family response regulator